MVVGFAALALLSPVAGIHAKLLPGAPVGTPPKAIIVPGQTIRSAPALATGCGTTVTGRLTNGLAQPCAFVAFTETVPDPVVPHCTVIGGTLPRKDRAAGHGQA